MPQPSATIGVEAAVCPKASNVPRQLRPGTQATAIWCYRRSRLPFARLKGLKRSAAPSTRHSGHSHLLLSVSKMPFVALQRPIQTLRGSFDQALRPQPSATSSVRSCRLPALKGLIPIRGSFDQLLWPQCRAWMCQNRPLQLGVFSPFKCSTRDCGRLPL